MIFKRLSNILPGLERRLYEKAALIALTSFFFTLPGLEAPASPLKGWDVSQVSQFQGKVHIRITPSVGRIDSNEYTVVLLPDTRTLIYNNSNKTFCEKPRKEWLRQFGGSEIAHANKVHKARSAVIAGRKATLYICDRFSRNGKLSYSTEFWTCSDLPIAAENAAAYCVFCDVPSGYGLPMRITRKYRDHTVSMLDTLGCREMPFEPAVFKPLNGFKKVKDEMELIMAGSSSSGKDDFSAIFGEDPPSIKQGGASAAHASLRSPRRLPESP